MKRSLVSGLLLSVVLLMLSGCLSSGEKTAPTPEKANETPVEAKVYEIACETIIPFSYEENGEAKGIFLDLVREAFRRMDYKFSMKFYPWARGLNMLENGNVDALCTTAKQPERERFADYSQPVVPYTQSLFVLRDSQISFDGSVESLRPYTIGIVEGYTYDQKFEAAFKDGRLKSEPVNLAERNFEKLLGGRIDICMEGKYVGLYTLKKLGYSDKVKLLSPDVRDIHLYLAFSKKRNLAPLIEKFNKTLQEMKDDGTYQKIIDSYAK